MSNDDVERLCAGYRAAVKDPPYDSADAALLRAAARRARHAPLRRLACGIAAILLATVGLAAGLRSVIAWHGPPGVATRTTTERGHVRSVNHFSEARRMAAQTRPPTNAVLGTGYRERPDYTEALVATVTQRVGQQQRDAGFLQEASANSPMWAEPTCGTGARVDLNAPGTLDQLRVAKPGDYVKVMRIIAGLTRHPELDVARWISTTFHAGNVSYFPLWMTSLPPKRRLSFCLENTGYSAVVTITPSGARASPTDYHGNAR